MSLSRYENSLDLTYPHNLKEELFQITEEYLGAFFAIWIEMEIPTEPRIQNYWRIVNCLSKFCKKRVFIESFF